MEVKGLGWLGIRTPHFEQTVALFRDMMGLEVIREEHYVIGLRFPDATEMEVWRPEDDFHTFFTTGAVVGFRVADVERAHARMEAAGIQFIGPVQHRGVQVGPTSGGPMGTSTRSSAKLIEADRSASLSVAPLLWAWPTGEP